MVSQFDRRGMFLVRMEGNRVFKDRTRFGDFRLIHASRLNGEGDTAG